MASSEVHLFAKNPATIVLAHALDGVAACNAKKLSLQDKVSLIALPALLAIATAATAMVTLPVMVPTGLGLGTLASCAYAIYRFYQSRTTTGERALKAMARGDYGSATALFRAMLKGSYRGMTGAKFEGMNAERVKKKLPHIRGFEMLHSRYQKSFDFANVRNQHDWRLFGELYGSCMLFELCQEMGKKRIAFKEVKDRLEQANFWMGQKKIDGWQADLSRQLEEAARNGGKAPKAPIQPVGGKSGAITLLRAIDRLQKVSLPCWYGEPSQHTKKFLASLQPWLRQSSVGCEGYLVYRKLMACKSVAEMQPRAQAVPQALINKLEALVS